MPIECVTNVAALAEKYDGFVLDIWGVVMDGTSPYAGARDCMAALQDAGKTVILLSNAPRRAEDVARRLAEIGVVPSDYTAIVCSGEASRQALAARDRSDIAALGPAYFYIGPQKDAHLLNGLDYRTVDRPDEADFILNTGPFADADALDDFDDILATCRAYDLPMICTNPDQLVVRLDGTRVICAGAIAGRYEQMGGTAHYFGKPHEPIYRACFTALKGIEKRRILALGDTLETDIAGAQKVGLDTALVVGGVLAEPLGIAWGEMPPVARIELLCRQNGVMPNMALPALIW